MESSFTDFMLDELKTLVSEIENAQQPSNQALYERICRDLRQDYDRMPGRRPVPVGFDP